MRRVPRWEGSRSPWREELLERSLFTYLSTEPRIRNTESERSLARAEPHQEFREVHCSGLRGGGSDRVTGGKMEPDQEKMKGELARLGGRVMAERD